MRIAIAICLCLLCAACVTPSDPDATLSLETRASQSGRRTPERSGLRFFGRRAVARNPEPDRFAEVRPGIASSSPQVIPDTPAGRQLSWLIAVLNGGSTRRLDTAFSENFFRRTSERQTRAIIEQWRRDEFADGTAIIHAIEEQTSSSITAILLGRTTGRYSRLKLGTDNSGRIASVTLTALLDYRPGDLAEWSLIENRLGELGGMIALAACEVTDSGPRPLYRASADTPLSIGGLSSFYIAGTLAELVQSGKARWDEPMPIIDELKSLMGGDMQVQPEEAEFPMSTYLWNMLGGGGWNGWGDTTAFDHLLARAGRANVEAYLGNHNAAPERNRPFLATMEYFRIKLGSDRTLPGRFAGANEQGRRALLSPEGPADKSLPSLAAASNWRLPFEVERIGWFASADDLSKVLNELLVASGKPGMEPLAASLRLPDALRDDARSRWLRAGVKSGTEPGILSMAWVMERKDGRRYTLVLLANDPHRPLRHTEIIEVASAAIALLADDQSRRSP